MDAIWRNTIQWIHTAIWIQYRCYTEIYNTMDMYSNMDTIRMPYREIQEIQYNGYVWQYRCHTEKYKVQPRSLVNSTILGGKCKDHQPFNFTSLDSSSVRSMLGDSKLAAKQLQPDFSTMQMSYDTENDQ